MAGAPAVTPDQLFEGVVVDAIVFEGPVGVHEVTHVGDLVVTPQAVRFGGLLSGRPVQRIVPWSRIIAVHTHVDIAEDDEGGTW